MERRRLAPICAVLAWLATGMPVAGQGLDGSDDPNAAACEAALDRIFEAEDDAAALRLEAEADRICAGEAPEPSPAALPDPDPIAAPSEQPGTPSPATCEAAEALYRSLIVSDPWAAADAQEAAEAICAAEEKAAGGGGAQVSDDGLLILELKLGRLVLSSAMPAFEVAQGVCVHIADLAPALDFAIEADAQAGRAAGWVLSEDRRFELDIPVRHLMVDGQERDFEADAEAITPTDQGVCVALGTLSRWFPVTLTLDRANLVIRVESREPLPVEARLEREERRKRLRPEGITRPDYPQIRPEFRWLGWPAFDLSLQAQGERTGEDAWATTATHTAGFSGEVAGMALQGYVSGNRDTPLASARASLAKRSYEGGLLGPLDAREYGFGDVQVDSVPLASQGGGGWGAVVSSFPLDTPDDFATTDLRGPLLPGWEVELYRDTELVAFRLDPDEAGEYVFEDVPLRFGYNLFRLRFHGPHGAREERVERFFVGGDMTPPGEIDFSAGVVRDGVPLMPLDEAREGDEGGVRASVQASLGITPRLSAGWGATTYVYRDRRRYIGSGHIRAGMAGGLHALDLAMDAQGGAALALRAQRSLWRTSIIVEHTENFGLEAETTASSLAGDLRRLTEMRVDTSTSVLGRPVPLRLEAGYEQDQNGASILRGEVEAATILRGAAVTKRVSLAHSFAGEGGTQAEGALLASRSLRAVTLRGEMRYTLLPDPALDSLAVSGRWRIDPLTQADARLSYAMGESTVSGTLGVSRVFDHARLSGAVSARSDGAVGVSLGLGLSLWRDPLEGRPRLGPPGAGSEAALMASAFIDRDGDGRYGEGDEAIEGAEFIVANVIRDETSDGDGVALLSRVPAGPSFDISVKQASVPDPYLVPSVAGYDVVTVAGRIPRIAFPFLPTGGVEGTVILRRGTVETPLADVAIEVLDASGAVVARGRTEFDGFYLVEQMPYGTYTVRIAPEVTARFGLPVLSAGPARVDAAEEFVAGLDFVIAPPETGKDDGA